MDREQVKSEIQELATEINASIEILNDEYTRIAYLIDRRRKLQARLKRSDRMRDVWKKKREKTRT